VFAALEFRDYGRVDFRLAPTAGSSSSRANPNPDLHPHAYGNHFNLGADRTASWWSASSPRPAAGRRPSAED